MTNGCCKNFVVQPNFAWMVLQLPCDVRKISQSLRVLVKITRKAKYGKTTCANYWGDSLEDQ